MLTAAKEGDPQAQSYLGVCYQTGQGVAQDYAEAVKWFRRAAEQDDTVAQCYLGFCFLSGQGVPQEDGEAAKWFREASAIRTRNPSPGNQRAGRWPAFRTRGRRERC